MKRALLFGAVLLAAACGRQAPAPLGEVRLVVDTDLPPSLVLHLRADIYADDGRFLDARDVARPALTDWPASFSVFLPDGATTAREVRVRVRVYPEGETQDTPDAPAGAPPSEPASSIAVDRLVRVVVTPGTRARANVLLNGECAGVPSDLEALTTCVASGVAEAAALVAVDSNVDAVGPSQVGTFGASPAPVPMRDASPAIDMGGPHFDGQVAIAGGAFVLGGPQLANGTGTANGLALGSTPTRLFAIAPLLVDQYEYTVGRFRALLARGFIAPSLPLENEAATDYSDCSWTDVPADREAYPLTCVSVATARAACQFDGGDLPTEAEWEYVASAWARPSKTSYPWGAAEPTCDAVTYGRLPATGGQSGTTCILQGARVGARAVSEGAGDVSANTTGPNVFGLGASVGEWTRDSYAPYTDPCWVKAGRHDPSCTLAASAPFTVRGGAYSNGVADLLAIYRHPVAGDVGYRDIGFRCVAHP